MVSLGDIPDSVLLEIVSYFPPFTKSYPSQLEVKESINTLNTMGKVNRRFHEFCNTKYVRGIFVKALLERSTLLDPTTELSTVA